MSLDNCAKCKTKPRLKGYRLCGSCLQKWREYIGGNPSVGRNEEFEIWLKKGEHFVFR